MAITIETWGLLENAERPPYLSIDQNLMMNSVPPMLRDDIDVLIRRPVPVDLVQRDRFSLEP